MYIFYEVLQLFRKRHASLMSRSILSPDISTDQIVVCSDHTDESLFTPGIKMHLRSNISDHM